MKSQALSAALLAAVLTTLTPGAHGEEPLPPAADALTADGGRYFGPLVEGVLQGEGRIAWSNGAHYEGGFLHGLFSGQGRLMLADGSVLEGHFEQGLLDGAGHYRALDFEYSGHFTHGLFAGEGELRSADGRTYHGQFANNRPNGEGRMDAPNGVVYVGNFKDGVPLGTGSMRVGNGGLFEGRFENWQANGPGIYVSPDGDRYEGNFEHNQLQGEGRFHGADGREYQGSFRDSRFDGQGTLGFANGDRYVGAFRFGMYHGQGTLTRARPDAQQVAVESGDWQYGSLDDPVAEQQRRQRVEAALYAQPTLLDQALSAVQQRRPGHINLYLLAVAGSSRQEVFRREAELVRGEFDTRFDTAGHSLVLGNSASTMGSWPLATLTSLRASLQQLGRVMDTQQDVLFLFLSSHGGHDHRLVFDPPGLSVPDLTPEALAGALRESGIQWRVLVISACYSGGFLDALRDDHTLIITAARADRTSFGCADDREFTEFGRAYFADALPAASSFSDAFQRAESLIRAREDERAAADAQQAGEAAAGGEGEGAAAPDAAARREQLRSYPQISEPDAIREHLAAWWSRLPQVRRLPPVQPAGRPAADKPFG